MQALAFLKLSEFFSKYLVYILGVLFLLAVLVITPNSSAVLEKFGIETRASLKAKTVEQSLVIEQAVKTNNELMIQLDKENKSSAIIENIVTDSQNANKKLNISVTEIKESKEIKISNTIKKPRVNTPVLNSRVLYTPEEIVIISEANIEALQQVYHTVTSDKGL